MPYITQGARRELALAERAPATAGELNYLFSSIARDYLLAYGKSYQTLNDIIGALEMAKLEMYRRVVDPYEDKKIHDNGDVYTEVL